MVLPLHKVIGILGNVISFGLFLSPISTFVTILSKKNVEQFSPLPYLATLLSCMVSIIYGLPMMNPNSILVLTMNGAGFMIESVWILIFFVFSLRRLRLQILGILAAELVFVGAILAGVLGGAHTHDKRKEIAGILYVIFNIVSYASPLSIMKTVIQTHSVEYMPFPLSLLSFLNTTCWLVYSLIHFDIYILVSNGIGAFLSIIQLALYVIYRTTPHGEPEQN